MAQFNNKRTESKVAFSEMKEITSRCVLHILLVSDILCEKLYRGTERSIEICFPPSTFDDGVQSREI